MENQQITLEVQPEALALWLNQRTTEKVMEFFQRKEQEAIRDWVEGNYPQETSEQIAQWTLVLSARQQAFNHMCNLVNYLNPALCSKDGEQ